mmetsp:Transcript_12488/g.10016  ORF Transcript_12488/g.10016 Transcript_12488/m.10016 type:complete len:89 (+) Transcript_12488:96-362(+)
MAIKGLKKKVVTKGKKQVLKYTVMPLRSERSVAILAQGLDSLGYWCPNAFQVSAPSRWQSRVLRRRLSPRGRNRCSSTLSCRYVASAP